MNKLIIIGAGGHGRVVADIAQRVGSYDEISFLDDAEPTAGFGYAYLGKIDDFHKFIDAYDMFVAIGNNDIRKTITIKLAEKHARLATIVAPDAVIGNNVTVGVGSVILSGVVVNTGSKIGKGVIVNAGSILDHDCVVEDFCHIAVGARLCGSVFVGANSWIGAGTTAKSNVRICNNCTVEIGSAIVSDLKEPGPYAGIPAKMY